MMAAAETRTASAEEQGSRVVAAKPATAHDPTEGPIDPPVLRLHGKVLRIFCSLNNLDGDGSDRADTLASASRPGLGLPARLGLARPRPHPEVPERSEGLEGALQMAPRSLEPPFEARFAVTSG